MIVSLASVGNFDGADWCKCKSVGGDSNDAGGGCASCHRALVVSNTACLFVCGWLGYLLIMVMVYVCDCGYGHSYRFDWLVG